MVNFMGLATEATLDKQQPVSNSICELLTWGEDTPEGVVRPREKQKQNKGNGHMGNEKKIKGRHIRTQ
jgi:hypothetical protein